MGRAPGPREPQRRRPAGPRCLRPHNAVDTPALLPDGTPSELSVSRVLTAREQIVAPTRHIESEHDIEHEIEEGVAAMNLVNYIYLATLLFAIGGAAVLMRRNAIIVFMGVELMLNATNLMFVTFSRMHGTLDGQVIALFVMVVAAAEVVVGLAIIMAIFRARRSASVDDANLLKL